MANSFPGPWILLLLLAFLGACAGRPAPVAGEGDGGTVREDGGSTIKPDACVRPPGGCFSNQDCPAGSACQGCGPDPCCPQCSVCYGKCVPTGGGCADNHQCKASEYCNRDGFCIVTGGIMGRCLARPTGCNEVHDPVCGCDGKTYSNDCVAHSNGVSWRSRGICTTTFCDKLARDYDAVIQAARVCCSSCLAIQCKAKVDSELACPCTTYVNALTTPTLKKLRDLRDQWNAMMCNYKGPGACKPCPRITGGRCVPATGTPPQDGVCKDF